ncbi:hypothetical protein LWI28_026179 [Acer negundo]|uniref:Uncharacterized protein n=1 Tax=Acer negundo TaxID=4023 RepID=A0AAD5J7K0_ACENE|nr:hypothetical protein LWI28_026179 [Acer negundo]
MEDGREQQQIWMRNFVQQQHEQMNGNGMSLGFSADLADAKVVEKILRSLPRKFDHVVANFEASNDLSSLTIDEWLESLQSHEDRMKRFYRCMNGHRSLRDILIPANDEINRVGQVARQFEEIDHFVKEMGNLGVPHDQVIQAKREVQDEQGVQDRQASYGDSQATRRSHPPSSHHFTTTHHFPTLTSPNPSFHISTSRAFLEREEVGDLAYIKVDLEQA